MQFKSPGSVGKQRLRTAISKTDANLHPGNRLPIFINDLASEVRRDVLSLSNCARRVQKRNRQKYANARYPKILAHFHFAVTITAMFPILSWMRSRKHAFPRIENLGL
jgi:hypothetical protein